MTIDILTGDCRHVLPTMPDQSVQTVVTSPPYFGLRDYGHDGQIGLEPTPDEFVAAMVQVFREVRRVLRDDGTVWLNLGNSYAGSGKGGNPDPVSTKQATNAGSQTVGCLYGKVGETARRAAVTNVTRKTHEIGMKPKDLIGIPWRVAFALQADGWYLRQDIIWSKPNPMPESVRDRCTKAHEYIFLLSKSERYYYDAEAIAEPSAEPERVRNDVFGGKNWVGRNQHSAGGVSKGHETRNKRSVWEADEDWLPPCDMPDEANKLDVWKVATQPFKEAHFATYPPDLIKPCILAGCPEGGTVLDPFGGAGTTGLVADRLNRNAVLIELNPEYAEMARNRLLDDAPLLVSVGGV